MECLCTLDKDKLEETLTKYMFMFAQTCETITLKLFFQVQANNPRTRLNVIFS